MADVFISYKRERRPAASYLQKILVAHGFSAWYDYGLVPGEDFERRLMGELRSARCVVVLWCGLSVQSPWVVKEAMAARARGTLLPTLIERATPPDGFEGLDMVDLTAWDGAPSTGSLSRLLRAIGDRVGRKPASDFDKVSAIHEDWVMYGRPNLSRFQTVAAPRFDPSVGAFAQLAAQAGGAGKVIESTVQAASRLLKSDAAQAAEKTPKPSESGSSRESGRGGAPAAQASSKPASTASPALDSPASKRVRLPGWGAPKSAE